MPGPYSSLMVLRRRRSGRGGLRVPEKTDLRGLWEIYCRLKRHCAVILSYVAKYLPSRFKVPPLRLEIYRDLLSRKKKERKKTDNPREGWEDGTPPPHRDFKEGTVWC